MEELPRREPESSHAPDRGDAVGGSVILYDGLCGLCDRLVRFTMKRDRGAVFRFAPLQSEAARGIVRKHGADPDELDTLYLIESLDTPDERLHSRSRAVLGVLRGLGWPWRALGIAASLPKVVLDLGYRFVAKYRYRLFGRHEHCRLPDPAWRDRFISWE